MVQILGGEVYSPAAGVKEMTEEMLEQRLTECGIPFSPDLPGKLLKYHELGLDSFPGCPERRCQSMVRTEIRTSHFQRNRRFLE